MPGRPIYKARLTKLQKGGPELEQAIFTSFIENPESIRKLTRRFDVDLRSLYDWLHEDPERWARWQKAKEYRAQLLAEDITDIADDVPQGSDAATVSRAKLQIEARQWLAAVNAPALYGKHAGVTIAIGSVHLEALRDINAEDTARRLAAAAQKEAPSEVVIADPQALLEPAAEEDLLG